MTRIKICGITNVHDAWLAAEYGADALGFIFVDNTPRYIGNDPAAVRIPKLLPPFVRTVAVYRDVADIHSRWERNFGLVQVYENRLGVRLNQPNRIIRAFRIQSEESLAEIEAAREPFGTLLLDAYHPGRLGGAGETFDWELAVEAKRRFGRPVILAGGLNAENVGDAIAAVRPYAIDVSSGVESEPGRKDPVRLRAFIMAVRRFDIMHGDRNP